MKKLIVIFVISLISLSQLLAQNITTIEAKSFDISDNLDLDAVASIFGEARNLEDFENKLNDPRLRLSNLDLNEDGLVDYLRVIETSEYGIHLVTIQALVARDLFQDVAVISVEKDNRGLTTVQVIGDVYMYGPDYIIQPVYVHPPVIWAWFRGPYYSSWRSPYYWGYYPTHYHHRRPCHPHHYHNNVYVHINVHNTYHRTHHRISTNSVHIQKRNRSNDYGRNHSHSSFAKRNNGVKNRTDLNRRRDIAYTASSNRNRSNVYSRRETQHPNRTTSVRDSRNISSNNTRQTASTNRTVRGVQGQRKQASDQQNRVSSTRTSTRTPSTQRQNSFASQTQHSNRQQTQTHRSHSTRAQSKYSNSSRSKTKAISSTQRRQTQKNIAKSDTRTTNSRQTTRSDGYGRI